MDCLIDLSCISESYTLGEALEPFAHRNRMAYMGPHPDPHPPWDPTLILTPHGTPP
jgi:hypothetical protein